MTVAAPRINQSAIEELLAKTHQSGLRTLTETESKQVLALAGIPVPREEVVQNPGEAAAAARKLGSPVVLKIISPDIAHKSDVGGVRLGLASPEAVEHAAEEMLSGIRHRCPQARIEGLLIAEMLRGQEVILGTATDTTFGPVIMFGLGGVFVESLQDVAFRMIPLDRQDASAMLSEIKGAALLNGFRGSPPVNKDSIVAAILSLSQLAGQFRSSIQEIDINPLLATPEGVVAVDALIKLN
jgi:acyl-CoA synthetase (NDP forming)